MKVALGAGVDSEEARILGRVLLQEVGDVQEGLFPSRKPCLDPNTSSEKEDELTSFEQTPEASRNVMRRASPIRGHRPALSLEGLSRQV
jgi:hypothetical protein